MLVFCYNIIVGNDRKPTEEKKEEVKRDVKKTDGRIK
jgi:hypothetical protein